MTRTVRLGDREIPRMGLGTNRLTNTPANVALVREAVAAGVGMIDTAHLYTRGESEATVGEALTPSSGDHVVATKGGYGGAGRGRPEVIHAELEASRRRLRVDTIELYYLHRVDPETPIEVSLGAIKELVDRGQVRHVGISEVTVEQVERARAVVPIAAVQNQYNIGERKYDDVVDHCTREGIVFVPYYPLHGEAASAQAEIAADRGLTSAQVGLAWLLKRSPLMLPIPGTLSPAHLRENLAALDIELSDEEFEALG